MGHFSCACQSRASHQRSNQRYNFVEIEPSKETFAMNGHKTAWSDKRPERKFFAHLRLVHGGKRKVLRAQIDSASTYNTMPQSLLRKLFPGAQTWKTKITISTYGDQPLRPRGQVTLCCERKGKLHILQFLVVDVPQGKPPLHSGRDAQALHYLMIYADETHAVERAPVVRQQRRLFTLYKGGCPRTLQQRVQTRTGKSPRQPLAYRNGL